MKTITTAILGLIFLNQISQSQNSITLNDWTYLSDSNIVVLFARNELNNDYLIIPVESYFNAIEKYLFKNNNMIEFIEELNIEFVYDEYIFNEGIRDAYLVFEERSIFTCYGEDLRNGENLCSYNCISEILFNESLRAKPDFVIIDNSYFSDIKRSAWNSPYQIGSWIDTTAVIIEKGPKIKMERKNKRLEKWLSYKLTFPYTIDYISKEPIGFETTIKIRKLPKMQCYYPKTSENIAELDQDITQIADISN